MSRVSHFNYARRPFRDYRPVYLVSGAAFALGALLLVANIGLWTGFRRQMEGTLRQIAWLEAREARAAQTSETARQALNAFKVSTLAAESRGLMRLVQERRFSWIELLARLERRLPNDVRVTRLSPKFEESGEILLSTALIGKSSESVVRTITALSADPVFRTVELHSESTPEQGVPEGYTFLLTIQYAPPEMP